MRSIVLAAAVVSGLVSGAAAAASPPLLPLPAKIAPQQGRFDFRHARIAAKDGGERAAASRLTLLLRQTRSPQLAPSSEGSIRFRRNAAVVGEEAYRLTVTPTGVTVEAATDAGLFYGAETLWQLIAASQDGTIEAMVIDDTPAFAWRGLLLDSARHFQPPAFVKALIDRMAAEKLNVLHWHLVDDQGWRIPIDKYPRLIEIGAWRRPAGAAGTDAAGNPVRYGGFYTKAEIREIVAYAAERHITIVPEIEMPGHATAAIAAYPTLAAAADPVKVPGADWGVYENLFNTEDSTFTFLQNVLDEVIELFPSTYIHVGGDEAVKVQWIADPRAQARIKALGLKNEAELQGWFIARIGDYLATKGRKIVGWDEILEGHVPPSATVMSWHGIDGGIVAAKAGHDAVLSPSPDFYLDHMQSMSADEPSSRGEVIDWKAFYETPVMPHGLTDAERAHILGVQANLWTEHMRTTDIMERQMWPRAAMLAEIAWTAGDRRKWDEFATRLPAELAREKALGIGYNRTPLKALGTFTGVGDKIAVSLEQPVKAGTLHYTTDGSAPLASSPTYGASLTLAPGTMLRTRSFLGTEPFGEEKSWTLSSAMTRTRSASELELCSRAVPLRPEDDAETQGKRRVFWGDIFHPCWIWRGAPLAGIKGLTAEVGQVPFNYQIGPDLAKLVFDKPETKAGELLVRLGAADGPIVARVPLGKAADNPGVSTLTVALPVQTGPHDLYFSFAQHGPEPLWMLDRLTLDPAQ